MKTGLQKEEAQEQEVQDASGDIITIKADNQKVFSTVIKIKNGIDNYGMCLKNI